jgi:protein-tyrosine phosphatase
MTQEINETRVGDVLLVRTGDDSVTISWKPRSKDAKVVVYKGEEPDADDRQVPAANVTGKTEVSISGLDPDTRYYFDVVFSDQSKTRIGERRVQLEGGVNFRDLGGYRTIEGRRVKWGQLFRSDNLGRLTDRDVNYLQKMGIRLVCDFRTPAEIKKLPDRYPTVSHGQSMRLPIQHGQSDPANTFDRIKSGEIFQSTCRPIKSPPGVSLHRRKRPGRCCRGPDFTRPGCARSNGYPGSWSFQYIYC